MNSTFRPTQLWDRRSIQLPIWRKRLVNLAPKTLVILLQGLFCLVVAVPVALLWFYTDEITIVLELLVGFALLLAPLLYILITVPERLTFCVNIVLPVADLVGLGLIRWATLPDGSQLGSLALAPALWLVVRFGLKGVFWGTLLLLATMSVPSVVNVTELTVADFARFTVLPVTFIIVSALVVVLFSRLSHQHAELRRSDRLVKGVIDHLNVGVLVMDADGHDMMANPAQRDIHDLVSPPSNPDPTEAGHLLFDLDGVPIPPEERPARKTIRGEAFDNMLMLAGPPTGGQSVLCVTSRIIDSPDGSVESRILIFDNISDAYNAQRAQQDIIATVSHELRTPLTSILGYTDFAIETLDELPEEDRRELGVFLDVIERNGLKLLARVEDLLLQQKTQYGNLKLNRQVVSLADLAGDAVRAQCAVATAKDISLELEICQEPVTLADPQRINQVMDNLLSNALKFTPSGGRVQVRVDHTSGTDVTPEAIVAVTDTGPGMAPKELEKLFTPFYRTQSATESAEGTGLGLSVAKGIVETHHGRIEVESRPGQGATFTVRLPLHEEDPA